MLGRGGGQVNGRGRGGGIGGGSGGGWWEGAGVGAGDGQWVSGSPVLSSVCGMGAIARERAAVSWNVAVSTFLW